MTACGKKRCPVVLVVEDDAFLRFASASELTSEGFEALEAGSADEALAMLDSNPDIHAVFTDITMPGSMNGIALANHVSRLQPQLYILITSGEMPPSAQPMPQFSDFVPKPYALTQIAALIRARIPAHLLS